MRVRTYDKEKARLYRERTKDRQREYQRQYFESMKKRIIDAYGGKCTCCGEDEISFLSIDHIHNDGAAERRQYHGYNFYCWIIRNGFPQDRYQCLCMNCQFGKRQSGGCPHQKGENE